MYSIEKNVENIIEVKKSKFICKIYKIHNEDEIKIVLNNLKKEYKDSTHICYSYIVNNTIKFSDDNEPNKTAGFPIYNVLKNNNLNMILCVVIRYFGGIKLGTGGLVRAYTKAVTQTLALTKINELKNYFKILIEFNYNNEKIINNFLTNHNVLKKQFNDTIIYEVLVEEENFLEFKTKINQYLLNINIIKSITN